MIKVGDEVIVNFHSVRFTLCSARVDYIPCATGDAWHFTDLDNGDEHYVSEGCTITKTKEQQ